MGVCQFLSLLCLGSVLGEEVLFVRGNRDDSLGRGEVFLMLSVIPVSWWPGFSAYAILK